MWATEPLAGLRREIWVGWLSLASPTLFDDVDPVECDARSTTPAGAHWSNPAAIAIGPRTSCAACERRREAIGIDDVGSVRAVSAENRADSTAICVGVGLALAIGLLSGIWVVGVVIGIAVGAALADRLRLRAGLPQRQLLAPRGRDRRKR